MRLGWLGFSALLWSGSARAESGALAYETAWTRAPGAEVCPSTSVLERALARYLGPPSGALAPRVFEASVSRAEASFVVVLRVRSREGVALGERELRDASPDCGGVLEATAFAIALAVDPERALQKRAQPSPPDSDPAQESAADVTPPAQPSPVAPPPVAPATPTPPRQSANDIASAKGIRLNVWGQASLALLVLPRPQWGPELGIEARGSKLSGRAVAALYPRNLRPGLDVSVGLTTFWALGGYSVFERDGWLMRGEGGLGLGAIHAASDFWYAALRAGGSVERQLPWGLAANASFHAIFPWWRREQPDEERAQWHPPPLGLLFGLGVSWRPE